MKYPLLGPEFEAQSPEDFRTYVQGLYEKPVSKSASSAVAAVGISFLENKTIVRVKRDPKYVTAEEIRKLAEEYQKPQAELFLLFKKRKIEVRNPYLKPPVPKAYGLAKPKKKRKKRVSKSKSASASA